MKLCKVKYITKLRSQAYKQKAEIHNQKINFRVKFAI